MDLEEMRRALMNEMERTTITLGGEWAADQTIARERLAGYQSGLEYALGLIGTAPTPTTFAEEIVQPEMRVMADIEPEWLEQVEGAQDVE
jgi:hypothetical protein